MIVGKVYHCAIGSRYYVTANSQVLILHTTGRSRTCPTTTDPRDPIGGNCCCTLSPSSKLFQERLKTFRFLYEYYYYTVDKLSVLRAKNTTCAVFIIGQD